jgi:hypothetical protein
MTFYIAEVTAIMPLIVLAQLAAYLETSSVPDISQLKSRTDCFLLISLEKIMHQEKFRPSVNTTISAPF